MVYKEDNYSYIQHTVDLELQVDQDAVDNQELHCLAVVVAYQYRVADIVEQRMVDNHMVGNLLVVVHTVQHYYKVDKLLIDLRVDWMEEEQLEDNLIGDVDCRMLVVEYMNLVLVVEVVAVAVMLVMDMVVPGDHLVDGMLIQIQMVPGNLDHMMLVLLVDEHMVMELVLEYMMLVLLLV